MIRVFHTTGDGSGWAIDEDLRQIRESLRGVVRETSLADAQVVHSPFWMALSMHPADVLADRFVIAHADNPPFFYLKQPEFIRAQEQVDLWVARSREADEQFQTLGLKSVHIPYTIDPGLFHPLVKNREEKRALRRRLGLPESTYLIANFHRDSEGSDLHTPKLQKAPELMVMTVRRLRDMGAEFHVLLAGPRRHWIREQLEQEKIAYSFIGREGIPGDDFGVNILSRPQLNELYNAADLYFIPSRWEGGPQSVMEAAASRCKILSTPLGLARDILEPGCLFRSASEAAEILAADIREGHLGDSIEPQFAAWKKNHTTPVLAEKLRTLYGELPADPVYVGRTRRPRKRLLSRGRQLRHNLRSRLVSKRMPGTVSIRHREGENPALDKIMSGLRSRLADCGVPVASEGGETAALVLRGCSDEVHEASALIQFVAPGAGNMPARSPGGCVVVAPSVQDVVNLRRQGCLYPALVLPFLAESTEAAAEAGSPLVLEREDQEASLRVWEGLMTGRPILYPEQSAYYEQAFHAGLPYADGAELDGLKAHLLRDQDDFRALARVPDRTTVTANLTKLLTLLSAP